MLPAEKAVRMLRVRDAVLAYPSNKPDPDLVHLLSILLLACTAQERYRNNIVCGSQIRRCGIIPEALIHIVT